MNLDWATLDDADEVPSPALLVYPERVDENLRQMIATVGGVTRLRPHIKTHKMPQLVARQRELGIEKCKCATIAEAEMAAAAGVPDVLLAGQITGPNVARFIALGRAFPGTRFSVIGDDAGALGNVSAAAVAAGTTVEMLLDLDVGQHRTGIAPGGGAIELYRLIASLPGLVAGGLHSYDGHLHQSDVAARNAAGEIAATQTLELRAALLAEGLPVPRTVVGGSPTFPVHAQHPEFECSPGTTLLWDAGYATNMPDLDFVNAAVLLTRVISRPTPDRICLDLGHKSVASEMPHPRVIFPALPEAKAVGHNEEHLVLETSRAAEFPVGTVLYGVPWHICPTVALHDRAHIIRERRRTEEWPVVARARKLTI